MLDVIIVGGGAAGLSAGLTLGRFRRQVLICDSQQPRNARSSGVHGFLSRDGMRPQELLQIAREQLIPYPTVQIRFQTVSDIAPWDAHFKVTFEDGTTELTQKVLFATGVKDILPPIEGMEALWGRSVYHCPYCHGWEARDKAIAILANGETALHFSKLLHGLSHDIVICTNGQSAIGSDLHRLGIQVNETPIVRLHSQGTTLDGLVFADGSYLQRDVIFMRPAQEQHSDLPARLGCAMTENGYVAVDEQGKTSIEGVYAAGDLAFVTQQVVLAAARGFTAAAAINAELAQAVFIRDAQSL